MITGLGTHQHHHVGTITGAQGRYLLESRILLVGHRVERRFVGAAIRVIDLLVVHGPHRQIQAAGGTVTLTHSNGATVKIDAAGNIEITANVKVKVTAPAGLDVTAAMVTVDAAMSTFSGVVKADTVITNSVVSSSYTPGAGNIW